MPGTPCSRATPTRRNASPTRRCRSAPTAASPTRSPCTAPTWSTSAGIRDAIDEILPLLAQAAADNPGLPAFQAAYAVMLCECGRVRRSHGRCSTRPATPTSTTPAYDFTWLTTTMPLGRHRGVARRHGRCRPVYERLAPFETQGVTLGGHLTGTVGDVPRPPRHRARSPRRRRSACSSGPTPAPRPPGPVLARPQPGRVGPPPLRPRHRAPTSAALASCWPKQRPQPRPTAAQPSSSEPSSSRRRS